MEGREPDIRRRTSKGNKAHGRIGRLAAGNGRAGVTDPTAEESLGVEQPTTELRDLEPATEPGGEAETEGTPTTRGQRPQRCGTAAIGWNSSRGVKCVAGNAPASPDLPVSTGWNGSSEAGNTTDLMTGSGMQQARDLRAEETIEVVQNHEDGTGLRSGIFATEAGSNACGSGRPAGSVEG